MEASICKGQPGTRITVKTILEFLAAGESIEDVVAEYRSLVQEDVLACFHYSSRLMGNHFRLEPV